jgi:hypothetical protein
MRVCQIELCFCLNANYALHGCFGVAHFGLKLSPRDRHLFSYSFLTHASEPWNTQSEMITVRAYELAMAAADV